MKLKHDVNDDDMAYIGHLVDQICTTLDGFKKLRFSADIKLLGKPVFSAEGRVYEDA